MFGVVLSSVVTLMHLYVFWRLSSVPEVVRRIPRKYLIGTGAILWGIFLLGRYVGHDESGSFSAALELIGMNWMATLFIAFVSMLAVDILTGFGYLFKKKAPSLRGMAIIFAFVLSIFAMVQGMRPPVVSHYEVHMADLPENMNGTVLVAVSDMHIGSLIGERWLRARVDQINAMKPDLVVLLGDIFEGHGHAQDESISILENLSAPLGTYAVLGNHEFHRRRDEWNISMFERSRIQLLRNRWIEVRPGLIIAGVDDLTSMRRASIETDIVAQSLANRPPGAAIFLSHTPWQAEKAAVAGAGLMLSGHTHAGQIWPFGYLVRKIYPLLAGRYNVNGMTVMVCRGTGTWGPRMRLWHPGEILRVTLYKNSPISHSPTDIDVDKNK